MMVKKKKKRKIFAHCVGFTVVVPTKPSACVLQQEVPLTNRALILTTCALHDGASTAVCFVVLGVNDC